MNGKQKKQRIPMLPSFLYVNTLLSELTKVLNSSPDLKSVTFYYDHFNTTPDGKNPPLVISTKAMDSFTKLTSIDDEHILLIDEVNGHYKRGDRVHIINGPFKGIEGRVTKITGQKRVIVELPELCSVATAYIPKAFLIKIYDPAKI